MMNQKVFNALNFIREAIHKHTKGLSKDDYKEVLEEVCTDIEGKLDALEKESVS